MVIGNFVLPIGVVLTVVFTILKVTRRVKWPWLVVLLPLWLPVVLAVLAAFLIPIILGGQGQ